MSKVTMTPLRAQTGDYGQVRAHEPVQVDTSLAERLGKSPLWVRGLTDVAKARRAAVAERQQRSEDEGSSAKKAKGAASKPAGSDGGAA